MGFSHRSDSHIREESSLLLQAHQGVSSFQLSKGLHNVEGLIKEAMLATAFGQHS